MTNEEAIAELKREIQWGKADLYPYVSKNMIEACEKAIKALEQQSYDASSHQSKGDNYDNIAK